MPLNEDLELLNAVLALAMADGSLSRSEMGVIEGLAARLGVGRVSLEAMIGRARREPEMFKDLRIKDSKKARRAMALLVAQARIDGEISGAEREMLVKIALQLGIETQEFGKLYSEAITQADELRTRRGHSDPAQG
jgi:tellurite resistance protein